MLGIPNRNVCDCLHREEGVRDTSHDLDAMMQDPEIATKAPSNVMLIDYPIREFRSRSGCCDA